MKKLLAVFMVCFAVFAVNAQNYLLQESFDGGVIPTGWTSIDNDGDGFEWNAAVFSDGSVSHTGNGCVASFSYDNDSWSALTPDNWLISPAVTVPAASTTPTLSFWAESTDASYPESIEVLVSTGTTVADFTSPAIFNQLISNSEFAQFTIDLSAYAGQTIHIAFVHRNVTDMFCIALDDIEVYNFTDPVMTVTPTSFDFGSVIIGNAATRTASVFGALLTSNVTVTTAAPFSVSLDGTTYSTNVSMPSAGDTLYVQYTPTTATTDNGTVTLTSGSLTQTITLTGAGVDCSNEGIVPFTEDFNYNGDLPDCWTFVYGDDDPTVNTITATVEDTLTNNYAVRFSSYSSSADYNQYMISSPLTYNGTASQLEVSALVRAYAYGSEKFVFGYSTTTSDISAFTWGEEQTISGTTYVTRSMVIPSNARHIAIRYYSNWQYYMYVDQLSVSVPDPDLRVQYDTINFGITYFGQDKTIEDVITGVNLSSAITATTVAPFSLSSDSVNFSTMVALPQAGGVLYVKYSPNVVGDDEATVTIAATGVANQVITLMGSGYDCTGAISALPYTVNFNDQIVPPLCWSGDETALGVVSIDTAISEYALLFGTPTFIATPIIEVAPVDMWASFDYSTYAGLNGYTSSPATSFRVGYSTTTNEYSAFTWGNTISSEDDTLWINYREYIPAGAQYVAIEAVSIGTFSAGWSSYRSYLFVDNFALVEVEPEIVANPAAINFGAIEINTTATETSNITGILLTENISATTAAPFSISIDGTTFDTTAVLVPAGGTLYVRFAPTAEGSFNGTVALSSDTLSAVITLSGSADDCSVPVSLPFTEDFEDALTACWANIDNDGDGFKWYNVSEVGGYQAHDGTGAFASNSYDNPTYTVLNPDNWLITPALVIPAEGGYISWYDAAQDASDPADHYELMVSTTGTAVADFTSIWEIVLSTTSWTERVVDLAAYANQTIHIAFVHNECADEFVMKIDDINVQAGAAPVSVEENAANAVSMYPNPASTVLNVSAENFDNVQIINFLGQVVYSANITENNFQINVSNLSNGVYFLRLNGENVVTKKFVKR